MTVYESGRYRDPLDQMIRQEEKTCKGCRHEGWVEVGEKRIKVCKIKTKHGSRCKSYEERE